VNTVEHYPTSKNVEVLARGRRVITLGSLA
jgi:hypothetical protein